MAKRRIGPSLSALLLCIWRKLKRNSLREPIRKLGLWL
nr:MAG TPA: hypothetical protein [Caudoviricetes sp.]